MRASKRWQTYFWVKSKRFKCNGEKKHTNWYLIIQSTFYFLYSDCYKSRIGLRQVTQNWHIWNWPFYNSSIFTLSYANPHSYFLLFLSVNIVSCFQSSRHFCDLLAEIWILDYSAANTAVSAHLRTNSHSLLTTAKEDRLALVMSVTELEEHQQRAY